MATRLPRLIGLNGPPGCGKDTLADWLCRYHDYLIYSLAGPLKMGLCAMFGWDLDQWDDRVWKEKPQAALMGKSPRYLAQTLGTEWGRNMIHPDVWVNLMRETYDATGGDKLVIPDIRFANEAKAVRDLGGVILRIERTNSTKIPPHPSENGIPHYMIDGTVDNNADLAAFRIAGISTLLRIEEARRYATRTTRSDHDDSPRQDPDPSR